MNIDNYNKLYHVDISTQIDNKWKNDSVLAIVKDSEKYSIKIKGKDKEIIKKRFIIENKTRAGKRHNRKVIAIVYSYLFYKALYDFPKANPLLLCRDVRPEILIMNNLKKISSFFKNHEIMNRTIKFRKRIEFETQEKLPKSLAGKYAKKVYQEKLNANKTLNNEEIEELIVLIGKLL